MDRRRFIRGAGASGAAAAATLATPAIAQGKRQMTMVTTWPRDLPGLGTGAQRIADRITKMSDGQLTVTLHAAGEMMPPFESFDEVSKGTADMYHGADYYWQDKSSAYSFFSAVPFGMTANEIHAWIHHMGGQQLWDELGAGFNLKHLPAGNTGVQMGGWFNREINSVADLKGLKIRMPGLGGEVLRRIGAEPVSLAGNEILDALKSGAVDAAEWVGPWNDLTLKFHEAAKYYYYPGFHEPGTMLSVGLNLDLWNSLTQAQQTMITSACFTENDYMLGEFNAANGQALETLVTEHKVVLRRFDDAIFADIAAVSRQVLEEVAGADEMTARIHASFTGAMEKLRAWTALSDQQYSAIRDLAFEKG